MDELTQADNPYGSDSPDARAWEQGFLFEFSKRYFGANKSPEGIGA